MERAACQHRALTEPGAEIAASLGPVTLAGDLAVPVAARGVVLFAHGSGSSRFSPRNRQVARALHRAQLATLLIDLPTAEEEAVDAHTAHLRFDIPLLAGRLAAVVEWLARGPRTRPLNDAVIASLQVPERYLGEEIARPIPGQSVGEGSGSAAAGVPAILNQRLPGALCRPSVRGVRHAGGGTHTPSRRRIAATAAACCCARMSDSATG